MNILNYLKIAFVFIVGFLAFSFGSIKTENKNNKEKIRRKEEEEKDVENIKKRIIKRDNDSINTKRELLRKRASKDK